MSWLPAHLLWPRWGVLCQRGCWASAWPSLFPSPLLPSPSPSPVSPLSPPPPCLLSPSSPPPSPSFPFAPTPILLLWPLLHSTAERLGQGSADGDLASLAMTGRHLWGQVWWAQAGGLPLSPSQAFESYWDPLTNQRARLPPGVTGSPARSTASLQQRVCVSTCQAWSRKLPGSGSVFGRPGEGARRRGQAGSLT